MRTHTGQDSQRFWASQSGWRGSKSRGPSPRGRRESEEGQGGMRGQQGTEDGHSKGGGTAKAGGRAREIWGPPEGPGREGAAGERTQRQGNPGREHSGRPRAPSEANGVMSGRHASQSQGHTEKTKQKCHPTNGSAAPPHASGPRATAPGFPGAAPDRTGGNRPGEADGPDSGPRDPSARDPASGQPRHARSLAPAHADTFLARCAPRAAASTSGGACLARHTAYACTAPGDKEAPSSPPAPCRPRRIPPISKIAPAPGSAVLPPGPAAGADVCRGRRLARRGGAAGAWLGSRKGPQYGPPRTGSAFRHIGSVTWR